MQSPIIALCKHFLNHDRCSMPQKKIGHVEDDEDNNEKNLNELQLNLSTGKKKLKIFGEIPHFV